MLRLLAVCGLVVGGGSALRIGVVGAGPGGLSLALALEQMLGDRASVSVFDRADQLRPAIGGGIQLNSGAAILARLGLGDEVLRVGQSVERVLSRNVAERKKPLLSLDLRRALRGSRRARETGVVRGDDVYAVTMMRDALQDILAKNMATRPIFGRDLTSVHLVKGNKARCTFADESHEDFDLVVGADGLRSAVRAAITQPSSSDAGGVYDTGIDILWGVGPAGLRPTPGELHQWFAPGGNYGLAATYGGLEGRTFDQIVLVSKGKKRNKDQATINAAWAGADDARGLQQANARLCTDLEAAGMPRELQDLGANCDRIFELSSHGVNPLGPWTGLDGHAVLIGDAAHAMPPFLGQGTNQAVQDAYCLAMQLKRHVDGDHKTVGAALAAYERLRKPPNAKLAASSRILGFVETAFPPFARDAFFQTTATLGVAEFVFLDGAVPTV